MDGYLFVFGTLLSGYDHPMAHRLSREAKLLGQALCRGRLYLVSHYPGIVPSDDDTDCVAGELYDVSQRPELLAALDDYEGYREDDSGPNEFVRRRYRVTCQGREFDAWVYFYNESVADLPRIASGDFLQHIARTAGDAKFTV